jgi:hypothetical protein
MRIAQIAPLAEAVPPKLYGGTERVVAWLTEELLALGYEVTLFASGDSSTRATLVPVIPRALRLEKPRPGALSGLCRFAGCIGEGGLGFRHCALPHRLAAFAAARAYGRYIEVITWGPAQPLCFGRQRSFSDVTSVGRHNGL